MVRDIPSKQFRLATMANATFACVAWRFCQDHDWAVKPQKRAHSSRFPYLRPPLLFSAPNQNRHATQANATLTLKLFKHSSRQSYDSLSEQIAFSCLQSVDKREYLQLFPSCPVSCASADMNSAGYSCSKVKGGFPSQLIALGRVRGGEVALKCQITILSEA